MLPCPKTIDMRYPNFSSGKPHIYKRQNTWIVRHYDRVEKRVKAFSTWSFRASCTIAKYLYEGG